MNKTIKYIIVIAILAAIGYFLYKKFSDSGAATLGQYAEFKATLTAAGAEEFDGLTPEQEQNIKANWVAALTSNQANQLIEIAKKPEAEWTAEESQMMFNWWAILSA